jgi:hypothetical protein
VEEEMKILTASLFILLTSQVFADNGLTQADIDFIKQFQGNYQQGTDEVSILTEVSDDSFYISIDVNVGHVDRTIELTDIEDFDAFRGIAQTRTISLDFEPIESFDYDFPDLPGVEISLQIKNSQPTIYVSADNQSSYFDFDRLRDSWGDHDQEEHEVDFQLRQPEESFNYEYFETVCKQYVNSESFVDWDSLDSNGMDCVVSVDEIELSKL